VLDFAGFLVLKFRARPVDKYSMREIKTSPKGLIPTRQQSNKKGAFKYLISLRFVDFRIPFTHRIVRVELFSEFP